MTAPRNSVAAIEAIERALTLRLTERLPAPTGKCPACWMPHSLKRNRVVEHVQPSIHGATTCPGSGKKPMVPAFDFCVTS